MCQLGVPGYHISNRYFSCWISLVKLRRESKELWFHAHNSPYGAERWKRGGRCTGQLTWMAYVNQRPLISWRLQQVSCLCFSWNCFNLRSCFSWDSFTLSLLVQPLVSSLCWHFKYLGSLEMCCHNCWHHYSLQRVVCLKSQFCWFSASWLSEGSRCCVGASTQTHSLLFFWFGLCS